MAKDRSFDDLMTRLRAGDEEAARQIFHRFAGRLIGLARLHLDARVRGKLDAEDVVQSVFKSFFLRHGGGQFSLADWDSLWGLLVVITLRKCGRQVKHHLRARRDVRRETDPAPPGGESGAAWEALAREPSPEEAAVLVETVEQLQRGLDEADRQVVVSSLQGLTVAEISRQLGLTERRTYRVLERVRSRLERMREAEASAG